VGEGGWVASYMVYLAIALSCAGPAAGKMAEFFQFFLFHHVVNLPSSLALTFYRSRSGSLDVALLL
jgi:hypothetical protein